MKIIVDTCVWSLALRRKTVPDHPYVIELCELIQEGRAQMLGPIRQELLSGLTSEEQFEQLKSHLSVFPDLSLPNSVYEEAARYYNLSRRNGIQGSNTDFLICAAAVHFHLPILTMDQDFQHFQQCFSVELYALRRRSV